MATYPAGIYSPRTKVNKSGIVYDAAKETSIFAEDIVKDDDEIVAVETELGTNAKGAFASVKAWLENLTSAIISVFTDIPDVPDSYSGEGGKVVQVKATEDGLEFAEVVPPDFPMKIKPNMTRWVIPGWKNPSPYSATHSSGFLYYIPIFVSETTTYIRIAIKVSTLGVGLARLGIYNFTNGLPGTLVLDAGTVDVSSIGVKEITISEELTRGYYFLAVVQDVAVGLVGCSGNYSQGPVPTFETSLNFAPVLICLLAVGRSGDVAGGLASPAPTPVAVGSALYTSVALREN